MEEIKAFGCDYCGMTSRTKGNVKRHELNSCRKNPNRKTCGKCKNLDFDDIDGYFCDEAEEFIHYSLNINMDCNYFVRKN